MWVTGFQLNGVHDDERLLAIAVVIDVAGVLQADGILWETAALLRLRLASGRLRCFVSVAGVRAAHWTDHRVEDRHCAPNALAKGRRRSNTSVIVTHRLVPGHKRRRASLDRTAEGGCPCMCMTTSRPVLASPLR